jgi:hypothetical protein
VAQRPGHLLDDDRPVRFAAERLQHLADTFGEASIAPRRPLADGHPEVLSIFSDMTGDIADPGLTTR